MRPKNGEQAARRQRPQVRKREHQTTNDCGAQTHAGCAYEQMKGADLSLIIFCTLHPSIFLMKYQIFQIRRI